MRPGLEVSRLVELSVLGVPAVVAPHLRLIQSGQLQLSLQTDLSRLYGIRAPIIVSFCAWKPPLCYKEPAC